MNLGKDTHFSPETTRLLLNGQTLERDQHLDTIWQVDYTVTPLLMNITLAACVYSANSSPFESGPFNSGTP